MISETDFFDRIQQQLEAELPFVAYKKPNRDEIHAVLQHDQELHYVKDFTESGFVFAPFDPNRHRGEEAVLIPVENSINCHYGKPALSDDSIIPANIVRLSLQETLSHSDEFGSSIGKENHIQLVQKGVEAIKKGELQKVVLSRAEVIDIQIEKPQEIFKKLLHNYPTAFVYLWYHPKVGSWLGATPETLLKIKGDRFKTMALAGTQKFEGTLNVKWEKKEIEEQQIVTESIVDNLQSSISSITVSEAETVKAGNLLHLKTDIIGTIKDADSNTYWDSTLNLLNALHPTPAVCGFPKEKAKRFILKNEGYNREFYTGFLGELNISNSTPIPIGTSIPNRPSSIVHCQSSLYVNLRCMQLKDDKAIIYVGGGITKGSDPENEWEETVNKSKTMLKVLLK